MQGLFADAMLQGHLPYDRTIWNHCQQDGWVLFTEDRNCDESHSLEATLRESWRVGHLPVLTLASKSRFENSPAYATHVVSDLAELLFGISQGDYRDQPRIYVPRR
jgi:hypothetical protein